MNSELINWAVKLISDNLGSSTAESYKEFYKGKGDDVIRESVNELLTEILGEKKAREKMKLYK